MHYVVTVSNKNFALLQNFIFVYNAVICYITIVKINEVKVCNILLVIKCFTKKYYSIKSFRLINKTAVMTLL